MTVIAELFNDAKFIIKFRRKLMKRQMGLNQLAPKVGDLAPDFSLSDISGTESATLSDFRGKKPVALIFGSFT
jgi:hypothetical protein